MSAAIRVLVVDDSPQACRLMISYLQAAPDLQVVGTALNSARAVKLVKDLRPDVVTLDLEMPNMGGFTVLDCIMHECPTPIVALGSAHPESAQRTLEAVKRGAVDFIPCFPPSGAAETEALRVGLTGKVRAAAQVRVVRSLRSRRVASQCIELPARVSPPLPHSPSVSATPPERIVVIGASTGGPSALRELLGGLPADFPAAILVIQHMPEHFTAVLAAQLHRAVALTVREATEGDEICPGMVLIAPGDYHTLLRTKTDIQLTKAPAVHGHRPSIDVTMQSVAQIYGARAQGVVLTGMGADGAQGIACIHAVGGMTFAQDADSCVVDGMPQRAMETGAVDYVGTPAQIAQRLLSTQRSYRKDTE